jgi:LPS export ABC transporter protein LptC
MRKQPSGSAWIFLTLLLAACSFDYDASAGDFDNDPDVVMKDVEYVRMENALPVVRIRSKEARRYEAKHAMEMDGFSFEQYNPTLPENAEIPDINVRGDGGSVRIETDSRNLTMAGGVSIDVQSEDFSLRTETLSWEDKDRLISAPGEVTVTRSDGTRLSGRNLSADTRRREWRFEEAVSGDIVEEDEETEDSVETEVSTADETAMPERAAAAGKPGIVDTDDASSAAPFTDPSADSEDYRRVEK